MFNDHPILDDFSNPLLSYIKKMDVSLHPFSDDANIQFCMFYAILFPEYSFVLL